MVFLDPCVVVLYEIAVISEEEDSRSEGIMRRFMELSLG
jgi:hypothetical protein